MSQATRWLAVAALLIVMGGCIYMAVAAREAPHDSWWAYWLIYAVVGLFCALGVFWLLNKNRPQK